MAILSFARGACPAAPAWSLALGADDTQWLGRSFFEIDQRTYAPIFISDDGRIRALTQHVSSLRPLPSEDYLREVRKLRVEYAGATLAHVLKNFYRTKWRSELVRLAITRLKYLWSIRKDRRRSSPNLVYTGSAYVRPKEDREFP